MTINANINTILSINNKRKTLTLYDFVRAKTLSSGGFVVIDRDTFDSLSSGLLDSSLLYVAGFGNEDITYSSIPNSEVGDFTVSRNSTAVRVNKNGAYEDVPANTPVFNYDFSTGDFKGLFINRQMTNHQRDSEPSSTPSTGFHSGVSYAPNDWGLGLEGMAVYGDNSEFRSASNNEGLVDGIITCSALIKTDNLVEPVFTGPGSERHANFRISGATTTPESVTHIKNNIYFCVWKGTYSPSTEQVGLVKNSNNNVHGFQVSALTIFQGDVNVTPYDYIRTFGSQVTRQNDFVNKEDLSGFIGSNSGRIELLIDLKDVNTATGLITLGDGTADNYMSFYLSTVNRVLLRCAVGGNVLFTTATNTTQLVEGLNTVIIDYDTTGYTVTVNGDIGSKITTGAPNNIPLGMSRIDLGVRNLGFFSTFFGNHILLASVKNND